MSEYAGFFASTNAGLLGLLIFFVFFLGSVIWVFRPGSKDSYNHDANIPLRNDDDRE